MSADHQFDHVLMALFPERAALIDKLKSEIDAQNWHGCAETLADIRANNVKIWLIEELTSR